MPVTNVPSTDTPNAGRVKWNDSDNTLLSSITSLDAELDTHKSSADHDARYYTESEVDTAIATAVGNVDAALTTHKSSADHDTRYYTESEIDATIDELRDYIQERIKTGNFVLRSFGAANIIGGSVTEVPFTEGKRFVLPQQCTLRQFTLSRIKTDGTNCQRFAYKKIYTFQPTKVETGYTTGFFILRPELYVDNSPGGVGIVFKLFAGRFNSSNQYVEEEIFATSGLSQPSGNFEFDLTLQLSL